jgi:hypothetical protein
MIPLEDLFVFHKFSGGCFGTDLHKQYILPIISTFSGKFLFTGRHNPGDVTPDSVNDASNKIQQKM